MHMVEAFLAAGDATGDARWYERALRIAERLIDDVARAHDWRILEHFDAALAAAARLQRATSRATRSGRSASRPATASSGRACCCRSTPASATPAAVARSRPRGGLFARATDDGWGAPGGFAYTTDLDGRPVVADRLHWPVTEAIGAAAALHAVTGDARYEHWYRTCWDFAGAHLIDRARGSWHAELDDALQPSEQTWSGKPDVYHSLQATLIPRLPVSPSLAGALRDGPLA